MDEYITITSINSKCPNIIVATKEDYYINNLNQQKPFIIFIKENCCDEFPYKKFGLHKEDYYDNPPIEYESNGPEETNIIIDFVTKHPEIYMPF